MGLYRKRPVVIEARQFDGTAHMALELRAWIGGGALVSSTRKATSIIIPTLEGDHTASPGDWIIKGVAGEFYPCKPAIFEATYESAD